jgi:hypothetical protein
MVGADCAVHNATDIWTCCHRFAWVCAGLPPALDAITTMTATRTIRTHSSQGKISRSAWLIFFCAMLFTQTTAQETYTNAACRAVTSTMNSCAKRWDSIRTECTKRVTTNTVWPGPCECAYFTNDMPCFDEQEFCAAQVWTQVPQWFRDGVTSCLMKDANFTVRAQLGTAIGSMGNPFTVNGLAGKATRTVDARVTTPTPAQTSATASIPSATGAAPKASESLSTGAKAGFGVGISVGVILVALAAFAVSRSRRKPSRPEDAEKPRISAPLELHDDRIHIHQLSAKSVDPKLELSGNMSPRYELGTRTSTWLGELPNHNSLPGSRR